MFLISHVVLLVTPSIQIDINFLSFFRLIDQLRTRTQSAICDLLKDIPELSKNWIHLGRPCSPRVVFVFEAYYDLNDHLIGNKRKYELYLEDQLYRFLRKSRIITNICSNALFAVCNQTDFVHISTKQSSIRDSNEFFDELLHYYCNSKSDNQKPIGLSTNICNELLSLDETEEKERTFFDFLWNHINTALTKGFDDNVGRHNVTPIFELPKLITFSKVLMCLKDFFFKQLVNENNSSLKSIANKLLLSLDTDNIFTETRCSKILPVAFSFYREKLPPNYTQEIHEQKLNQTLQFFTSQVRGLSARKYVKILEQDCEKYWKNGHQVCGVLSLFNNHCMNPIHRTKSTGENDSPNDSSIDNNLKVMDHNSSLKYISACNCGRRQGNRDDPFTIKQANNDFYYNLSMKCDCNELTSFEFPIFEGALDTARPALLNRFINLDLEDEDEFYSTTDESGSSYEDESEDEKNQPIDDNIVDKLQTQLESQPSELSQIENNLEFRKNQNKKTNELIKTTSDKLNSNDSLSTSTNEDLQIMMNAKKKIKKMTDSSQKKTEYSKTEYLAGMLNSKSPKNLLPIFNSWSLVCLGPSSIYSHNLGVQSQPGFITNCNFLLPWDVTVKIEHSGDLPKVWSGKKLPGIKNKKVLQGSIFQIFLTDLKVN